MAKFAFTTSRSKKYFLPGSDKEYVEIRRMGNVEKWERDDLMGKATYEIPTGGRKKKGEGSSLVHMEHQRARLKRFEYESCITDFLFIDEDDGKEYKFDPKRKDENMKILFALAGDTADFVDEKLEEHNGWGLTEEEEGEEETPLAVVEKNLPES